MALQRQSETLAQERANPIPVADLCLEARIPFRSEDRINLRELVMAARNQDQEGRVVSRRPVDHLPSLSPAALLQFQEPVDPRPVALDPRLPLDRTPARDPSHL